MSLKVFGALMIFTGCGGYGVIMAQSHRREVAALHQLVIALNAMVCELEFRLTPLPELCRYGASQICGPVGRCLTDLADALDTQVSPDVSTCTVVAIQRQPRLPRYAASQLRALGQSLGHYDLTGQLSALGQCKQACLGQLEKLEKEQPQRLRSYQTLGFCAGAALAILLF